MPFDTSKFRKADDPPINTPPPTRSFSSPTVNMPEETPWYMDPRTIGAGIVRGVGGFAPGGWIGAGANAITEGIAQTIEDKPYNLANIGGATAMGAIPFPIVGKALKVAAKGAALGGAGTALRQQTEEGLHIPNEDEAKQIALGIALGGVGGAVASKFNTSKFARATPKEAANKEVAKVVAQATEIKSPTSAIGDTRETAVKLAKQYPSLWESKYNDSALDALSNSIQRAKEQITKNGQKLREAGQDIELELTRLTPEQQARIVSRGDTRYGHGDLAKFVKETGKDLVPIQIGETDKGLHILDGHHRFRAYQEAGIDPLVLITRTIPGKVGESNINFKVGANPIIRAVSEIPSKVPAEPKILLPRELAGAKPTFGIGSRLFEPKFENDIDKALYIIARPKKSAAHDKYVAWLQNHLDMDEKELQAAGMEVRSKLKIYLGDQPTDGAVTIPKLYVPKPISAVKPEIDIVTGLPKGAPDTPIVKPPTAEVPVSTEPQVDLQEAIPEVSIGDKSLKPQTWKTHPIRKAAAEARQLQTSFDLSYPFRQGIGNVSRKEFWHSFKPMMKSALSEANFEKAQQEIATHPRFELMEKAGLEFPGLGKSAENAEEAISRNTMVEKLGFGNIKPIRASNRAYTAFASKLRKDLFISMADDAEKAGMSLIDPDGTVNVNGRAIARYINDATGRGHLGQLEKNAALLNDMIFSPKLMASRVNMFRRAFQDPRMIEKGVDTALAKSLRKRAIRDMAAVGGLAATSIGVSELNGAEGTFDPRATDFGKIKIGNTRLDLTGGFQQYVRVAAQLASGQSSSEGKASDRNRLNTAGRFGRNKLSPLAGLIVDWMAEENVLGEEFKWDEAAKDRIIPLIAQDIYEVYKEDPKMLPITAPASMFGVGVQSYGKGTTSNKNKGKKFTASYKMPKVKLN